MSDMIQSISSPLPEVTPSDALVLAQGMAHEQLALWMAIGRTIQAQMTPAPSPVLEPTEEELAAEDALWDTTFATPQAQTWMAEMAAQAKTEPSLSMFDSNGRWLVDDYTDDSFQKAQSE